VPSLGIITTPYAVSPISPSAVGLSGGSGLGQLGERIKSGGEQKVMNILTRFVREETGAETIEYALVLGLIALAAVAGLTAVGGSVTTIWSSIATAMAAA
jgi:pilus assembly protein Flp/PilA